MRGGGRIACRDIGDVQRSIGSRVRRPRIERRIKGRVKEGLVRRRAALAAPGAVRIRIGRRSIVRVRCGYYIRSTRFVRRAPIGQPERTGGERGSRHE